MFVLGVIAAAIVVVTALYLVSVFIAQVIDTYKCQKDIEESEEEEDKDADERRDDKMF